MTYKLLLSLTLLALAINANTSITTNCLPVGADLLYPFTKDGKTGFMDGSGQVVIKPTLTNPSYFFGGFAAIQQNDKWGYIDKTGTVAIPAIYDEPGAFSEGAAPVRTGKLWGYITENGTTLVPPTYQAAGPFNHGLARVATWSGFVCFDDRGTMTNATAPDHYFQLPETAGETGCTAKDAQFGFINAKGSVVIAPSFTYATDFAQGMARVKTATTGDKIGYINQQGTLIVKPQFTDGHDFAEGRAAVQSNGKWGYIDATGKMVIAPQFEFANDFSDGAAAFEIENDHWGYIDSTGAVSIPGRFEEARAFSNGLTMVTGGNGGPGIHFIDHAGAVIASTPLKVQTGFSGNLAGAQTGSGDDVYVDRSGKVISPH